MNLKKIIILFVGMSVILMFCIKKVSAEEKNKNKIELIQNIKNETNLNFKEDKLLVPCIGVLTSEYGYREINSPTASRNHKGIDIGAKEGTAIVAAHDGIVENSAIVGNYGKCIILKSDEYVTVYGHCSKLIVKKGEEVKKGQKIAEVGKTR